LKNKITNRKFLTVKTDFLTSNQYAFHKNDQFKKKSAMSVHSTSGQEMNWNNMTWLDI